MTCRFYYANCRACINFFPFYFHLQLREYIDDTEDYINIQVTHKQFIWLLFLLLNEWHIIRAKLSILQLDNHRNQLIQVLLLLCIAYVICRYSVVHVLVLGLLILQSINPQ